MDCPICNDRMLPTTNPSLFYCINCGKYYSDEELYITSTEGNKITSVKHKEKYNKTKKKYNKTIKNNLKTMKKTQKKKKK